MEAKRLQCYMCSHQSNCNDALIFNTSSHGSLLVLAPYYQAMAVTDDQTLSQYYYGYFLFSQILGYLGAHVNLRLDSALESRNRCFQLENLAGFPNIAFAIPNMPTVILITFYHGILEEELARSAFWRLGRAFVIKIL
ncbi:hypothetical protein GALMADRAFT_1123643 [Galerina marginata CBS 339.88]|uniref:Uncharacterized protein n=1 Tax=Galerina marginata (strain CBS 339.88) TaxID=685588 RepID=A0A067TD98_GALM3|nr:hypothetical protein GALMADRAFT_1123643 [Galerina marginata CBS 339.88]